MNKKRPMSAQEERELIESTERGEWRSLGNIEERRRFWRVSAERTLKEKTSENENAARTPIVVAIQRKLLLSFSYKHEKRTAEPYIFGYDHGRSLMLVAIQRSGGNGIGYRIYRVSEMSDVQLTKTRFFDLDPDYNPEDPSFSQEIAKLDEILAKVAA